MSPSIQTVELPTLAAAQKWIIAHHHQWVERGIWRSYDPSALAKVNLRHNDPRFAICPNILIAQARQKRLDS